MILLKFAWDFLQNWREIKFYAQRIPKKKKKEDWVRQIQFLTWKASQEQFKN